MPTLTAEAPSRRAMPSNRREPSADDLLTTKQVAEMLGVTQQTILRHEAEGRMPRASILAKRFYWRRRVVDEWIDAGFPSRKQSPARERRAPKR